ncbi:VapE family protein [Caballeronia sp. LZ033]|uniref:VapE domain-containing protein n=1 Tax=Caballeronia sp. LZ033 TaxID=3038566 RepID=UPI00285B6632|nr:VapE domain-containing protein [Caballeronia sp. LZ033]MDR5813070.1 VapE family protein [Caballeronia sp. LZ033]
MSAIPNYNDQFAKAQAALSYLDLTDRETWTKAGMAIKAELGEKGKQIWLDASSQCDNFKQRDAEAVWKSFKRAGTGVGFGTLIFLAKQNGFDPSRFKTAPDSSANREARRVEREAAEAREIAECQRRESEAAARGIAQWEASHEVDPSHHYVIAKGIAPTGAKQLGPNLVLAIRDVIGAIHSVQTIAPDGQKIYLKDGKKSGNFVLAGDAPGSETGEIFVCEGWATACSIYEAVGGVVIAAMDAGNLLPVAKALRESYSAAHIIVCADNDWATPGNPGLTKAQAVAKSVPDASLCFPHFDDVVLPAVDDDAAKTFVDFNDLHRVHGLERVRMCLGVDQRATFDQSAVLPTEDVPALAPVVGIDRRVLVAEPTVESDRDNLAQKIADHRQQIAACGDDAVKMQQIAAAVSRTYGLTPIDRDALAKAMSKATGVGIGLWRDACRPLKQVVQRQEGDYLLDEEGAIVICNTNVALGIRSYGEFRRDTFTETISVSGTPVDDEDYHRIASHVEQLDGFNRYVSETLVRNAVREAASTNQYDSAQNWLNSLEWDGNERVETFLMRACHLKDTPYHRAVSNYLWTAMAGRVLHPGVKADMVPILISDEGMRKSTFVELLSPDAKFYGKIDFSQKSENLSRAIVGKLVLELDELKGLKTAGREHVFSFITSTVEKWTPKYRETEREYPRRCIFIGSTNSTTPLPAHGRARRWLPLIINDVIDTDLVSAERDQLWAEAAEIFRRTGVQHEEADQLAGAVRDDFREDDVTESYVEDYLASLSSDYSHPWQHKFKMRDLESWVKQNRRLNFFNQNEAAEILKKMGYTNFRQKDGKYWSITKNS